MSLLAAVAVVDALTAVPPHVAPTLKWPNDIMRGAAKLGGILLERQGNRVVIGFGLNLARAPEITGRETASLAGAVTPQILAPVLAGSFSKLFDRWRAETSTDWLIDAWLAAATPMGTAMSVHDGSGRSLHGVFDGIEPDGALRLRSPNGGIEIVRAGDVDLA